MGICADHKRLLRDLPVSHEVLDEHYDIVLLSWLPVLPWSDHASLENSEVIVPAVRKGVWRLNAPPRPPATCQPRLHPLGPQLEIANATQLLGDKFLALLLDLSGQLPRKLPQTMFREGGRDTGRKLTRPKLEGYRCLVMLA